MNDAENIRYLGKVLQGRISQFNKLFNDTKAPKNSSALGVVSDCYLAAAHEEIHAVASILKRGNVRTCWHHVRALFELWVKAIWILADESEARAQRFFDFTEAVHNRWAGALLAGPNFELAVDFESNLQVMQREYASDMAKKNENPKTHFYKGKSWSPSIFEVLKANFGKEDGTAIYNTWYSMMSNQCHSSSASIAGRDKNTLPDGKLVFYFASNFFFRVAEASEVMLGVKKGPLSNLRLIMEGIDREFFGTDPFKEKQSGS